MDDGLPSGTLAFEWSVVSGPGPVAFETPSQPETTASFDAAGSYELRLTASDSALSSADEAMVLVASDASLPDLSVREVDTSALLVNPQTLEISGSVAALIGNEGAGPAAEPFEVTFFEDRNGTGAFEAALDNLVGVATLFGVDSGGAGVALAPVNPTAVEFSGNLIYAFADSSLEVTETNEANNVGSSAAPCRRTPFPTNWNVQLEWAWRGSPARPDFNKILMTPVVIDLNDDEVPDIVFTAHKTGAFSDGILTAVSGLDGSTLFQVTDPSHELFTVSQMAAGDIDLDGRPEVVTVHESGSGLVAFEHDGTFKWQSGAVGNVSWGGPSIGDIDADGTPEVIVGRTVLNHDGTTRWVGTGGAGDIFKGPLSFLADLDLDGTPELVAGDTAYRSSGTIYWQNALADGLNAVGNFDPDPFPEIAWVSGAKVALLEHDGAIKWGPIPFPTFPRLGGPPIAADFDGDGFDEIGVPDRTRYYVFDEDGSLLWEAFIDENSDGNGSSAFDFDGDGLAEIVHTDEDVLRIRRGTDGTTLFETAVGSVTAYESAIVADVDGDGEAEVVAVSDGFTAGSDPGLYVFGEANGLWTSARKIYNQHAYHVTNVRDDGTIPAPEAPSFAHGYGFRQNVFTSIGMGEPVRGCGFAKPDLTGSELRIATTGGGRELTVRVGNGGARVAGIGVPVTFYDGDPRLGGRRLSTARTSGLLHPGGFEEVTLSLPLSEATRSSVWVSTDDFGNLRGGTSESNEENNLFDSRLGLVGGALGQPDLRVAHVDTGEISGDWQNLAVSGRVRAEVRNQGESDAGAFEVTFFEDVNRNEALDGADRILASSSSAGLSAGASGTVESTVAGFLQFRDAPVAAFVDSGFDVAEASEENNVSRSKSGCAFSPAGSFSFETEWSWRGAPVLPAFTNVGAAPVVVDLNQDGFSDVVFSTFSGSSRANAHLRAVSGRDGSPLFTASALTHQVHGESGLSVGDIDSDGRPEIVAIDNGGFQLRAFEHDGTVKWESGNLDFVGKGAPTLADLEGDGTVEILMGRYVLNGNGTVRWVGTESAKGQSSIVGPMSFGVDLDRDGALEVLVGNVAYRASGALYWKNGTLSDGTNALAEVDFDEFPEIVHVQDTRVYLLEHTGEVIWGPLAVGIGNAGPPAVADFDGDGRGEIALASRDKLHLIEATGYVRWTMPVLHSAQNAGAGVSGFDFDGDGALELVYMDETSLRLYRGSDGSVLSEVLVESCDFSGSYPVVADVDGDGLAEVVAGSNSACAGSLATGVVALGGKFTSARPLWNEHGYRVEGQGTFRAQGHGTEGAFAGPDLTASFVRRAQDGEELLFTVRVGNAGSGPAGAGIAVSVYNGDPRLSFPLLAMLETTRRLLPGEFEDIEYRVRSDVSAESTLHFAVNDGGGVPECEEGNNVQDSGYFLNRAPEVEIEGEEHAVFPDAEIPVRGRVTDDGLPLGRSLTWAWGGFGPNSIPILFDDPHAEETVAHLTAGG
jgi:hypothetical protein